MREPLLQLSDLSVTYSGAHPVHAIRNVDLSIEQGEHVAIMGRSGSGKTSLLSVIGLLRTQTSGSLRFKGREANELSERARTGLRAREIGFVFQAFHLLPERTLVENVAMGLFYRGVRTRDRLSLAEEALDAVGLAERAEFSPTQLSGGEQQRGVIARALIGEPSLLLCDEPTGDLDSHTAAEVLSLLTRQIAVGTTVVVITHDPLVAAAADRTLRIADGVLQPTG
ncbi:ABC transporter ATP-binding protein [Aquihabitans sp. G128]|uniref:ABC transporter ATP-binding protein n=1 Tax=Aquihabitans sp. G128 TaxID=2849779 RepID=UPI001C21B429|nr:ABC transporter ATP-binding protein [Aquihabitans sp. G128]QXC59500.1 ABC transporter ATP-binding protein [Aquihabitans sp. G128]